MSIQSQGGFRLLAFANNQAITLASGLLVLNPLLTYSKRRLHGIAGHAAYIRDIRSTRPPQWLGHFLFGAAPRRLSREVAPATCTLTFGYMLTCTSRWGSTFKWTEQHATPAQYNRLKYTYDTLAEECLAKLDEISPPKNAALPRQQHHYDEKHSQESSECPFARDLYALLRDNAHADPKLLQLWTEVNTVPQWVDWDQIKRGQDVFYRYGGPNITGLAFQALLGGMGAARVVEVLARTGGFSTKVARRRLFETTQFILQSGSFQSRVLWKCDRLTGVPGTRTLEAIQPGGEGFISAVRVRFLHAAVRNRIMNLARTNPAYYDSQLFGIPINDLDCIGTISSFSSTLIFMSLPRQGIWMREQEILDYLALWRYIGYIMGTPVDTFATPSSAKAMFESLLYYEIEPSDTSKLIANNIIRSLNDQPPNYASSDFLTASARWLNGKELSDRLGLVKPSIYYTALVGGQCLFFMFVTWMGRIFPNQDKKRIGIVKKVFYDIIVQSKYGLKGKESWFEFKYVPELSTVTELNESQYERPTLRTSELRNLKWLGIGALALACVGYISYWSLSSMVGLVCHLSSIAIQRGREAWV